MKRALLVYPDGKTEKFVFPDDRIAATVAEESAWMHEKIGGYFQVLGRAYMAPQVHEKFDVLLDEEGKLKGLTTNWRAMQLIGMLPTFDVLVGPVLILDKGLLS